MSLHGQHEGSLNLTPEHLGPLEVRLSVNQGTASVWFGSQHADTRAALTEALPRLRELFADAGLQLGHAGVSHEAPRQETRDSEAARFAGSARGDMDGAETLAPVTRMALALGLVDTYA
jgi:flagellar hook-length control protein FliK